MAPLTSVTRPCADTRETRERAASEEAREKSMVRCRRGDEAERTGGKRAVVRHECVEHRSELR